MTTELIRRAAADLAHGGYAIALTGAGISTESGIPDFRGPSGLWTKNPEEERKAYERYEKFLSDPGGYWEDRLNAPTPLGDLGKMKPNPGHEALAELERMGIVKTVITQNIDNLHQRAGSRQVLDFHGNAFRLRCASCGRRYESPEFDLEGLRRDRRLPPLCGACGGIVKLDVVHFREPIPADVIEQSLTETEKCDVMLVCGTSAVVYPFASLPETVREQAANSRGKVIIEINAEPTPLTQRRISDYLIQGKTGQILPAIVAEIRRMESPAL